MFRSLGLSTAANHAGRVALPSLAFEDRLFEMASLIRSWTPSSRRWQRFLRSLPLDPDAFSMPLAEPGERDFIVCGAPRTGTTLLSAMLVQPPYVHTVSEPWDGMRLPPAALFASLRSVIEREGRLSAGKLDTSALASTGEVRWTAEGSATTSLGTDHGILLGIKWPVFWRYLPMLTRTRFIVTLRNPFAVIASFRRQGGRLRMGLDYDTAFNRRMNDHLKRSTPVLARRRVMLFDYIHERLLPYLARPNVLVVRYERWFSDPEVLLSEIATFLEARLGAAPARLRVPEQCDSPPEERGLILRECRTAAALGYRG
jgi:hypothetical protein